MTSSWFFLSTLNINFVERNKNKELLTVNLQGRGIKGPLESKKVPYFVSQIEIWAVRLVSVTSFTPILSEHLETCTDVGYKTIKTRYMIAFYSVQLQYSLQCLMFISSENLELVYKTQMDVQIESQRVPQKFERNFTQYSAEVQETDTKNFYNSRIYMICSIHKFYRSCYTLASRGKWKWISPKHWLYPPSVSVTNPIRQYF